MRENELALIRCAAADDTDAFVEVFDLYKPIVLGLMHHYNLRGMTREDWFQEARMALWRAVRMYDPSSGSQFGAYYKMILRSHFSSVIRHGLAKKRLLLNSALAVSDADVDLDSLRSVRQEVRNAQERAMTIRMNWQEFFDRLSPMEAQMLQRLLKSEIPNSAPDRRACERVRRKLREFLKDNEN